MLDGTHARPVRVRIAPSPTGNCHVGTARNALYNLLYARQHQGAFVLRIDDTDRRRSTLESERGVLEGLRWLGLDWDEGPDVGGPLGPYRQSERLDLYRDHARQLLDAGRAYHCFCTPAELEADRRAALATGRHPMYGGRCRSLSAAEVRARQGAGDKAVIRFRIEPKRMSFEDLVQGVIEQDAALIGDPIIVKADGRPTYSFATVVDEHLMRISHVLRGAEHINNTFPQLQMFEALGLEPPQFGHLALLLNPDRSKISKRTGAVFVGAFRDQGYLPEVMINHLALSGWNPGTDQEVFSWPELLAAFSLERCARSNAVFDRAKLLWLNGHYIRGLAAGDLAARALPFLEGAGLIALAELDDAERARVREIVLLEQERLKTLAELPERTAFFFRDPVPADCAVLLQTNRFARRHSSAELQNALASVLRELQEVGSDRWQAEALGSVLDGRTEALGWKRAELLMPVRIAVCGEEATPPLFETLALVGRDATLRRLQALLACR
jgi:glutamyl-tRNA synthetase